MTETIAPSAALGEIQLYVASLERAVKFYEKSLGFQLLGKENGQAVLGAGGSRLLTLLERPGAQPAKGTTGLYHFAVLLPERKSLARLLYHLVENESEIQGAADHGVSESLYLVDPDGNGIEVYCDRRRSEWPIDDLGRLQMGTEDLDIEDLVLELRGKLEPFRGLPAKTSLGHVHLKVRNLAEAEQFYNKALGFQVTDRYESGAVFVAAGNYHHHIGMNTWESLGAAPPAADAAGLRWFEILLPDAAALDGLHARLDAAGVNAEEANGGLLLHDPSQNRLLVRVK
jgi:catechol 2,3-dioxygenase